MEVRKRPGRKVQRSTAVTPTDLVSGQSMFLAYPGWYRPARQPASEFLEMPRSILETLSPFMQEPFPTLTELDIYGGSMAD